MLNFLACRKRGLGRHPNADLWGVTHHMDYLERVRLHTFEGIEHSPLELKLFLVRSMYDSMTASSGHSFSTLKKFPDLCNV